MSYKTKITAVAAAAALAITTAVAWPAATPTALVARTATPASAARATAPGPGTNVLPLPGPGLAGRIQSPAATPRTSPVTGPMLPSACRAKYGVPCYGAAQIRHLYGVDTLNRHGITGRGTSIAIVMPFNNPYIRHDLAVYSRAFGLAAPRLTILNYGHPKTADPKNLEQADSVEEATLDLEMAHAMAPGARLVYVQLQQDVATTPFVFGNAMKALNWASQRTRIDVVSWSYGFFEENYAEALGGSWAKARALINSQRAQVVTAVRHHITVVSADGDTGPTGPDLAGTALYTTPTVPWLSSDPLVTGVSGTEIHATDQGVRTSPDTVWTDSGNGYATGGGLSAIFGRPAFQNSVRSAVGFHRGVPDMAMNGSLLSQTWMYTHYNVLPGQAPGWVQVAGTSEASPLLAGVIALAVQRAGHPLGDINPALYQMHGADGIADVTRGCNTADGVRGFCATQGYDPASGRGTVGNATAFVRALVNASR